MTSENLKAQEDEFFAIKSIFGDKVLNVNEHEHCGSFLGFVHLPFTPFKISYQIKGSNQNVFFCEYLPPIELDFKLSQDYPFQSGPMFNLTCLWLDLSDIKKLCQHLESIWNEMRCEVLFTWFSFLQNETIKFLNYHQGLDINLLIAASKGDQMKTKEKRDDKPGEDELVLQLNESDEKEDSILPDLALKLQLFNRRQIEENEPNGKFDCLICFETFKVNNFVSFNCIHYYCKKCITNFFSLNISEGRYHSFKCPDLKCNAEADLEKIKLLVSPDVFKKLDQMLLSSFFNHQDVIHCPRKICQLPVWREDKSNLVHCPYCNYAFCAICKRTYHGATSCFLNESEKRDIVERYQTGSKESRDDRKSVHQKVYYPGD